LLHAEVALYPVGLQTHNDVSDKTVNNDRPRREMIGGMSVLILANTMDNYDGQ
jgi:hypothetical protein